MIAIKLLKSHYILFDEQHLLCFLLTYCFVRRELDWMFMLQVYYLLHEHGIHLQPEVEATTVLGTNYNSYLVSSGAGASITKISCCSISKDQHINHVCSTHKVQWQKFSLIFILDVKKRTICLRLKPIVQSAAATNRTHKNTVGTIEFSSSTVKKLT